jgi:nucleosome binding factor SPN SPT16 subunit
MRDIKEMQKILKHKESELDNQGPSEDLILTKGRKPALQDLKLRPTLSGRKTVGTLECHQNGFRFYTRKNEKLDVLFNNIKHAFFQPCDQEIIILIHFHLKVPIWIGRKKVHDIQFYTEAGVVSEDLTDPRNRRYNDFDEYEADEYERQQRKKLNDEFQGFVRTVEQTTGDRLKFDIPYR